jgi:transposase
LFLEESFFDPQDLTQVKYEMLRRVQKDEMPISAVAASFGISRPAFYKAQRDFARAGLAGLIPRRRGPKQGHKLTGEVLAFVKHIRTQEPDMTTPELVRRIQKKFSFQVHRRTVERALANAEMTIPLPWSASYSALSFLCMARKRLSPSLEDMASTPPCTFSPLTWAFQRCSPFLPSRRSFLEGSD